MRRLSGSSGALLLLLSAGAAPHGQTPSRLALHYDEGLVARDFPNPAARLTINGRTAWFLFDTGAGTHVMASWFAEAAGLSDALTELDAELRDSTGESVPLKAVRDLRAGFGEGDTMTLPLMAVMAYPAEFERAGVGGIISPQVLAGPDRAAAVDLRVPELVVEPFAGAVRRLDATILPRDQIQFCGSLEDAIPNLLVAIPIEANGRRGQMLPDSGANVTRVVSSSALLNGLERRPGGTTTGLAGKPRAYAIVADLDLALAGHEVRIDVRVVDSPRECGRDGAIGLDALRACALVLSAADVAVRCGS